MNAVFSIPALRLRVLARIFAAAVVSFLPFKRVRRFFPEELLLTASVLFLPVLYMMAVFALLSGIGLGRWVFPTGLLLWGASVVMLHREERWQRLAVTLLLLLATFALAAWATSFILDGYYDSRAYHIRAVRGLVDGINPYQPSVRLIYYTYPAAHWLLSASLVLWTQIFGASFAFTVVAVFAAFLCARRFLAALPRVSLAKSRFWRNLLATLFAANPIATGCFFKHYTDGLLVSTLLSVFLLMLCFVLEDRTQSRATRTRTAFCVVALFVLLVNIKFTGLVFGGVLGLTALAYGIRRGASRKTLLQLAGLGSGAAILGVVLFGFYPYATNAHRYGNPVHPFYPAIVFGEEDSKKKQKVTFMEGTSSVFSGKSQYERWWISLFSKHGKGTWNPYPLPPFSSLNARSFLHGFSSLFSGSLLLCLTLAFFIRHRGAWIVLAGVFVSILSFGVGFSFRHAPQNWWLPILFLVFLLAPDEKRAPLSRAQNIVVFVIVACLLYVSVQRIKNPGKRAVSLLRVVRQAEEQGGWFVTVDKGIINNHDRKFIFEYYKRGLTGVNLPLLSECPEKAERRRAAPGLLLCRP